MTENIKSAQNEEKNSGKKQKEDIKPEKAIKEFEECKKLKDEYLAGWQRERADFLNYKKEEMEHMEEILKYADMELVMKILPILDNFDIAEKNLPDNLKNDDNVKGLLQIKIQIQSFLKSKEAEEIKSLGQAFDPNLYEAIDEVKVEGKDPGIVVEEIQKGYNMQGKVLRPAKVRVSK